MQSNLSRDRVQIDEFHNFSGVACTKQKGVSHRTLHKMLLKRQKKERNPYINQTRVGN